MRIAFYVIGNENRSGPLTGENIRYGGSSSSGTDSSAIFVAEYLASVGYEVVFACENTIVGEVDRGVLYTNLDFDGVEDRTFDILVSMLWVENYDEIPVTITKALIYWSHMQWVYGIGNMLEYVNDNNLVFGTVYVSDWARSMTEPTLQHTFGDKLNGKTIYNPLPIDVISEVNSEKHKKLPHKVTFHATFCRGGRLVYDAMKIMDWDDGELHVFSYLNNADINWGRSGDSVELDEKLLHFHGATSKKQIFQQLAQSEYFIYPQYTPYGNIHKDTFSCVVAEALALGCIVITYPTGALPECYEDCCVWLDIPSTFNSEDIQNEPLTRDPDRAFDNSNIIVEALNFLEEREAHKDVLRLAGKSHVIENYNVEKIGNEWEDFIVDIIGKSMKPIRITNISYTKVDDIKSKKNEDLVTQNNITNIDASNFIKKQRRPLPSGRG